jgi:hypothetical protein
LVRHILTFHHGDDGYRWQLGLADCERKYDDFDKRRAASPNITVPTITPSKGMPMARRTSGQLLHLKSLRQIRASCYLWGIGHNLSEEAPLAFVDAVIEVDVV